jgi:phosphonopyruvate decarboxylase
MSSEMSIDAAVRAIARVRTDALTVLTMSGMGLWPELRAEDFRLVGLMGGAASLGLGLAIGRPDRDVWVVDGDGSLLMALGILSAVAEAAPERYVHIVLSNSVYSISGGQPVPGRHDWERLALSAGYRSASTCRTEAELRDALTANRRGPRMVVVECDSARGSFPAGAFALDPAIEASRVRAALAPSATP